MIAAINNCLSVNDWERRCTDCFMIDVHGKQCFCSVAGDWPPHQHHFNCATYLCGPAECHTCTLDSVPLELT